MPEIRGTLTLKKISDKEVEKRVVAYLKRLDKKAEFDKIRAWVLKAPVVLFKDISEKNGGRVVEGLQRLGAGAVFHPHPTLKQDPPPSPVPRSSKNRKTPSQKPVAPAQPPPVAGRPQKSKKRILRPAASLQKTGDGAAFRSPPPTKQDAPPTSGPRSFKKQKSPSQKTTKPSQPALPASGGPHKPKARNLRPAALVLLLTLTVGYALFFTTDNLFHHTLNKYFPGKANNARNLPVQRAVFAPPDDPIRYFEISHSPYVDWRLVEGMGKALKGYSRLFPVGPGTKPAVKILTEQTDVNTYRVSYRIKVGNLEREYSVVLSSHTNTVEENLSRLGQLLRKITGDFSPHVVPVKDVTRIKSAKTKNISRMISRYNRSDLLHALDIIGQNIDPKKCDPELILKGGEIFSWFTIFKTPYDYSGPADLMSVEGVSCFLIGSLFFDDAHNPTLGYYRGLLLLALGYEVSSLKNLEKVDREKAYEGGVLAAYIRYDFDRLEKLIKKRNPQKVIARYLLARAYKSSKQRRKAQERLLILNNEYPDFSSTSELLAYIGDVGVNRDFTAEYVKDVMEQNLQLINDFYHTQWLQSDGEFQVAASLEVDEEGFLEKWMGLHKTILEKSASFKGNGALLTSTTLKEYLRENFFLALSINFDLEAHSLGRMAMASKIANLVEKNFPGSTLSRFLTIDLHLEYGKTDIAEKYLRKIDIKNSHPLVIEKYMDVYASYQHPPWRKHVAAALANYRKKMSPNSRGAYYLGYYYNKFRYLSVAKNYLDRSLKLNPYYYKPYKLFVKLNKDKKILARNSQNLNNNYGFQSTAAALYKDDKQFKKAIQSYQKAIKLYPENYDSNAELGIVYKKMGKFTQAFKTWNKYFQYDDYSLSAVHMRNRIGNLHIAKGNFKKAYAIFKKNKESHQNGALIGFARASEKTGKILQAEKFFKMAAERYPNGDSPVDLALFYLRRNNPETAYNVLRDYERYRNESYYFSGLIKFYKKKKDARRVLDIVKKAHNGKIPFRIKKSLAREYKKQGVYDAAAELYASMTVEDHTCDSAALYFRLLMKEGKKKKRVILDESLALMKKNTCLMFNFANRIAMRGYYDSAFDVYEQISELDRGHKENVSMMMAHAWRGGSRSEEDKEILLKQMNRFNLSAWGKSVIDYLMGQLVPGELLSRTTSPTEYCMAHYYIGMIQGMEGRKDLAVKHFLISLETGVSQIVENMYAHHKLYTLVKKND